MKLIAAVDQNWGLGREGRLLFRISPDLKRFKELTTGNIIVTGRKTLATHPGGKPLANRENIVFTRDETLEVTGAHMCRSLEELSGLLSLPSFAGKEVFVTGGAEIYALLLPYCEAALITRVEAEVGADRFLPRLDALPGWTLEERSPKMEFEGLHFSYETYRNAQPRPLPGPIC